jgi:orotidine-5'-phosphate decarboxylase
LTGAPGPRQRPELALNPPAAQDPGRIIVALDFPDPGQALGLAGRLNPGICRLKVGFELFVSAGPSLVERLVAAGFDVFLDLKFHDIPNTVRSAAAAAGRLGVWMLNVHALGGRAMLEAAREGVEVGPHRPKLIAVTILTSLGAVELTDLGIRGAVDTEVLRLAALARASGLDGVVCSAQEAPPLRGAQGEGFLLVTPGIRPQRGPRDDQRRAVTPREAVARGADYLVIGRPITRAPDPVAAIESIRRMLA